MDEDDFDETRSSPTNEHAANDLLARSGRGQSTALDRASLSATSRARARRDLLGGAPEQPGIIWVRASDLLSSGTGRVAGRGLDFETELARQTRRSAATTRRAIRERADRLPPLSAFGRSPGHSTFIRHDLGRH